MTPGFERAEVYTTRAKSRDSRLIYIDLGSCSCLASDMQNGVGVASGFLVQAFEGFRGGQNDQFDSSLVSFTLHIVHNGKGAVESVANDQLTALPGNLLFGGERGVAEFPAIFSGGLLLPFLDLSPIDDHVVLVRLAVDLNRAEREISDTHGHLGHSSYCRLVALCNSSGAVAGHASVKCYMNRPTVAVAD